MHSARAEQLTDSGPTKDKGELPERLAAIIGRLERETENRITKRELIERRWLTDLAQYHGKYEDKVLKELGEARKSQLFINQTRPKTNACEARLSDMLFPTDDRNWGIKPTPVPELTLEAEEAAKEVAGLKQQIAQSPDDQQLNERTAQAEQRSAEVQAVMEQARKRSRAMQEEIDDHLREARYSIQAREVIADACRIGTGIMKGPVIGGRTRRAWQRTDENVYTLTEVADSRPVYWRIDPWAYFPDMDATSLEDSEGDFERHLMTAKRLRRLARQPGFDQEAIRRLLRSSPRSNTPHYIADLRAITGAHHDSAMDRYHVWEYHGPLAAEDLRDLAMVTGREDMAEDAGVTSEEIDPLAEVQVTIWFCQGELLKFGIHHLDSGDQIYSVFCLEKDEASIFGFGVPYLMRDSQKALNAGWRTMMDNAGLSSGPQIVVHEDVVEPANGTWGLEARKLWLRKASAPPGSPAFESYDIAMHQAELANIIELSKRHIDEETGISELAQGEQGAHTTQTAHGMSILMNAVNVVFRRIVKNWDDDMTSPNIRRMYDWLMQFSEKEEIKGDFEVDARGTSVLLVREMQSANLLAFLMQFGAHPTLSQFLKEGGLPALRKLVQTMMIPADELIKSDEDLRQDQVAAAEQPPQPEPEIMKLENEMNLAEMERKTKLELAKIERETAMMRLAAEHNMKLDELRSRLEQGRSEQQSKERMFAAEAAVEERMAARQPQQPAQGSGGYFSA